MPDNATLEYLEQHDALSYGHQVCLTHTDNPGGNGRPILDNQIVHAGNQHSLPGVTYWYKEWMNVGHTYNEHALLQLLHTRKVDR